MKIKTYVLVAAFALGAVGFGTAWYLATTSKEVAYARAQVSASADIAREVGKVERVVLVGFRISSTRSHLTFWISGGAGSKVANFVVHKGDSAWTVERLQE